MKASPCSAKLLFALLMTSLNSNQFFANANLRGNNGIVHQEDVDQVPQDDLVGIFVIADGGMYNPESGPQPKKLKAEHGKRTSNILLPDGTVYEVKNAKAKWEDRLVSGRDMIRIPHGYMSSNGTIDMMGMEPSVESTNSEKPFDRNLQEEYSTTDRTPDQDRDLAASQSERKLQTGTRTVLAVRVLLNDASYNFASQTGLSNDIFGNGVDPHNLRSQYAACSYNKLIFDKSPNRLMTTNFGDGTTAINNGVVDIRVNLNRSAGDVNIRNAVTTKINSVFGVSSPDVLANHVMYCLPSGVMSNAYAFIGSWMSVYNNDWCNYPSMQIHEIGHNLGYGHSNENGGYQDTTGAMGFGYIQDDGPIMCFNGAKSWQTGWYASKSTVVNPSTGGCFEGNLFGIADFGNAASSTVLLKINDLSSTDYYVAFNRQTGINSGTQEAGNQVTVTRQGAEGTGYAESELVAKLGQGGTWSGAVAGKNMVVTVLSINLANAPAFARVRISENGGSCTNTIQPITIQAELYAGMFGVIREITTDVGGGENVGNIQTGDWMYYPAVTIPITGTYRVSYRVAALYSGGSLQLERAGGSVVYGRISIPATGGYQTWTTISHIVTLSAGSEMFGILATGSGWNINWFTITKA